MGQATFLLNKPCGGCTACCSGPLPVPELDIERGKPCKHLCEKGCGSYEARIDVCYSFNCVWKTNFVPDNQRPDRSGAICKWVDDGSILLVPIGEKVSNSVVEYWKSFAKRHGQSMRVYELP